MQPDSITPVAARITSLNFSDDIMLVQSQCSPHQGVRPRPRVRNATVQPQTRRDLNHDIVSIEQSHYRRNWLEFHNLDVAPAMRQRPVTFLPQILVPGSFWGRRPGLSLPNHSRAIAVGA